MIPFKNGLRTTLENARMVPSAPPSPGHESSTSAVTGNCWDGGIARDAMISPSVVSCEAPP